MTSVLSVRNLSVAIRSNREMMPVVRSVSFDVAEGEVVGLVGESGSGKSMTMLAVVGLQPHPTAQITGGEVLLEGEDLRRMNPEDLRRVRGSEIAMVFQNPLTSLNPVMRVGAQVAEALIVHGSPASSAKERAQEMLAQVGMPEPTRTSRLYPHELSGGMRQRACIAMALTTNPKILIADEPTTALDVTIQRQVMTLVRDIQQDMGMAVIWITHDLGVVAGLADRVIVMYAGRVVEQASTAQLFSVPQHPYSYALLGANPPLTGDERPPLVQIPGSAPSFEQLPSGCPFHPRCPEVQSLCRVEEPPLTRRDEGFASCWFPPSQWRGDSV